MALYFKHKILFRVGTKRALASFMLLWISLSPLYGFQLKGDSTRQLKEVEITSLQVPDVFTISPSQGINRRDFIRYNAYNVADAVRNFSGVNIRDYGGLGGMKTISVRSLGANHTALQYDGIPVSDAQNGQLDLGKLDLANVQDITLINGQPGEICLPASAFSAASLLIVNTLTTRVDSLKPHRVDIHFHTGSFGLLNPSIHGQHRINNRWSVLFTSNFQKAHGRYRYTVDGDGSDSASVRSNAGVITWRNDLTLLWSKTEKNQFYIRSNYYYSDRGLPGAVVFYNQNNRQHLWNRELFIQSSYKRQWSRLQLQMRAKFSNDKVRYLDPDFLNSIGRLDQQYHQQTLYGSATLSYKVFPFLEVAYASDLTFANLNTNMAGFSYPERYTYLNALSYRLKLKRLELQSTLLHTTIHENVVSGVSPSNRNVWTPTIMASFQPFQSPNFVLRAFYKDIFRNPTFNDLYYTRLGNRSLKPEFATQYNVGLTFGKQINQTIDFLTLTTDFYYNQVKDKIIALPNKDLFTWSMLNLGKADIRGMDLGVKTSVKVFNNARSKWAVNYTYQQALDITDKKSSVYLDQIPYTPNHSLNFNSGLEFDRWAVFINQTYSSKRYYLPENAPEYQMSGFYISDLSGMYHFKLSSAKMSTAVEVANIFNYRYDLIKSYPMPGRSVRLSIQISI